MQTRKFTQNLMLAIGLILMLPSHPTYAEANDEHINTEEAVKENKEEQTVEEPSASNNDIEEKSQEVKKQEIEEVEKPDLNITIENPNEKVNTKEITVTSQYQIGDEGDHVVALKKDLVRLGFASWLNPSPNYGPITAGVVEDFQDYYNLPVTGIAYDATRNKIKEVLNPPYQSGDRGKPVVALKEKLVKLGFASWKNPSQNYGSITARVVENFQSAYGLTADGIAGDKTLTKLDSVLSDGKYQNGDSGDHVVVLKKDLVRLGFASWSDPSPNYGPITAGVVESFQDYFNLPVTGIAYDATRNKIKEILNPPYQSGDRGEPVIELKEKLVKLGFASWKNPSQNYGSITTGIVENFQSAYGLKADGIVGEETLAKLDELLAEGKFLIGDSGDHVVSLKKDLVRLGFASWSDPSPNYGLITASVVKDFQDHYNLLVTGTAYDATRNKIDEILNPPYQSGDRGKPVVALKEKLVKLGFASWENPSQNYGSITAGIVQDFQKAYGLTADGVVSEDILAKLDALLAEGKYLIGDSGDHVVSLKRDLVRLGFASWSNPSENYGLITAGVIEDFQEYYGLRVSGIANKITLNKIEEVLSSKFSEGQSGNYVIELKENLTLLGFGEFPSNPSKNYGPITAGVVRDFQDHYNLKINGIADDVTLAKIYEILSSPYRDGQSGKHIVSLKKDLVRLGFASWTNPSANYGKHTANAVQAFQKAFGLPVSGIADEVTLAKINEMLSDRATKYNITLQKALEIQMKVNPQTDTKYAWVSKTYIKNNRVTATALNLREGPSTRYKALDTLSKDTKVTIIDEYNGWYAIEYNHNTWVSASQKDVLYYLDPRNFLQDKKQQFQFLDLSKSSGASVTVLNNYLKGKGILKGQGQHFIKAARSHGVNDVYLISHATLETGNGTSRLANGIEVGKNKKGELELVTSENKNSLIERKKVYNMFGIGAYDNCALECGAKKAYEEGWTSVEKAIIGGAAFIGNDYIKAGQNTLYKMRWNPLAMSNNGKASHQYATDVGWASKQISAMYNLYQEIGFYKPILDIPIYK